MTNPIDIYFFIIYTLHTYPHLYTHTCFMDTVYITEY